MIYFQWERAPPPTPALCGGWNVITLFTSLLPVFPKSLVEQHDPVAKGHPLFLCRPPLPFFLFVCSTHTEDHVVLLWHWMARAREEQQEQSHVGLPFIGFYASSCATPVSIQGNQGTPEESDFKMMGVHTYKRTSRFSSRINDLYETCVLITFYLFIYFSSPRWVVFPGFSQMLMET